MVLITRSVLIIAVLLIAGCGRSSPAGPPVVLYTDLDAVAVANLTAPFTKLTGTQVAVRPAVDRGLATSRPQAMDAVLASDAAVLAQPPFLDQLQPLVSVVLDSNVPAKWRAPDGRWVALAVNGVALIYHPQRVAADELKGLADLADSRWRNRLCLPPANEAAWIAAVASLVNVHNSADLRALAVNWYANASLAPATAAQNAASIAAGDCDLTPAHGELFAKLQSEDPEQPLRLHWPQPGALARAVAGGVLTGASQPQQALKLIEYLSTPAAQTELARLTRSYPTNPRAELPTQLATYAPPRLGDTPLAEVLAQTAVAAEMLTGVAP